MCSLKERKKIFKNYMLIEIKKVFSLFLKMAREGLSRIINGNLLHSLGAAY